MLRRCAAVRRRPARTAPDTTAGPPGTAQLGAEVFAQRHGFEELILAGEIDVMLGERTSVVPPAVRQLTTLLPVALQDARPARERQQGLSDTVRRVRRCLQLEERGP
ncbi:hypothetical protein SF23_00265 [Streptomyces sp. MBRL 10]|nr:hypothetical protein SF23_00265 [Streptomyces sp. MBRL 10]